MLTGLPKSTQPPKQVYRLSLLLGSRFALSTPPLLAPCCAVAAAAACSACQPTRRPVCAQLLLLLVPPRWCLLGLLAASYFQTSLLACSRSPTPHCHAAWRCSRRSAHPRAACFLVPLLPCLHSLPLSAESPCVSVCVPLRSFDVHRPVCCTHAFTACGVQSHPAVLPGESPRTMQQRVLALCEHYPLVAASPGRCERQCLLGASCTAAVPFRGGSRLAGTAEKALQWPHLCCVCPRSSAGAVLPPCWAAAVSWWWSVIAQLYS